MGLGDIDAPLYTTGTDSRGLAVTINAQNTALAGVAPAGSVAVQNVNGRATATIQINTNTLSVALSAYGSLDGTNWFLIGGTPLVRQSDGTVNASIPAGQTGIWTLAVADFNFIRFSTPNSATTGSAAVITSASSTPAVVTIDNPSLATGSSLAGTAGTPQAVALAANTNQQLLAANGARKGAAIYNKSGQTVFIRFGAAATSSLFTVAIADGGYYEVPFNITASINALSTLAGAAVAAGVGLFATEFTA